MAQIAEKPRLTARTVWAGAYLTDGERLFYVVQLDPDGVVLEDCGSEELLELTRREFDKRRFRPVG